MRAYGLGLLAFGILAACATPAPKQAAAAPPTQVAAVAATDEKVCHIEQKTGSNRVRRVCLTQAEEQARQKRDQDAASKFLENRNTRPTP